MPPRPLTCQVRYPAPHGPVSEVGTMRLKSPFPNVTTAYDKHKWTLGKAADTRVGNVLVTTIGLASVVKRETTYGGVELVVRPPKPKRKGSTRILWFWPAQQVYIHQEC